MSALIPIVMEGKSKLLIGFPYAGGMASFMYAYKSSLQKDFDILSVEYLGRMGEKGQAPSFHQLCKQIAQVISAASLSQTAIYFVGISMGGYVAFKVAQILETLSPLPIKKIILFSVNSEEELLKALNPPWPEPFLNTLKNQLDPIMYQHIRELMLFDGDILRSMRLGQGCLKMTALDVIHARHDTHCQKEKAIQFWQQKSLQPFSYTQFEGEHIPDIKQFQECLLSGIARLQTYER